MNRTISSVQQLIPRIINFGEIDANNYDEWERFAQLLLQEMGYAVVEPPGRGADGGKDMLVRKDGVVCIVSCKHYANQGRFVGVKDEVDVLDRVKVAGASGFIAVYSTGASQGLNDKIMSLRKQGELQVCKILQGHDIEQFLLRNGCSQLVRRYFPRSYKQSCIAARVFHHYVPLKCSYCGQDLLVSGQGWIMWAEATEDGVDYVCNVGCACKGPCIDQVEHVLRTTYSRYENVAVLSAELSWYTNPLGYLCRWQRIATAVREGKTKYTDEGWQSEIELNAALSQVVMRDVTTEQRQMVESLLKMAD